MPWRMTARKGNNKITSGGPRKDVLVAEADRLKRMGYRTRVYKSKR